MCIYRCDGDFQKCKDREVDQIIENYVEAVVQQDSEKQFALMIQLLIAKADKKYSQKDQNEFKNCLTNRLNKKIS